jgi:2'-5' RNA ligase
VRLFVAVETGPTVARAAATLVDGLRRRAASLAPRSKVTWIPPERLHLTIRFIGNVDEERRHALEAALQPVLDVPSFALAIAGIGTFPRSGHPRVIWAGVAKGQERLDEIAREVTTRLERAGVPAEDRAFSPHLTLARVRDAAGLRSEPLIEPDRAAELGATRVEAITLFESRLSPKGPTYVALQHTPLRS